MKTEIPRLRMFAGPNGSGKSTFKTMLRRELVGIYVNPIVVSAINPYAIKRVNLTFREDILEKIDRFAKSQGLTRSSFLAAAALHELKRAMLQRIS